MRFIIKIASVFLYVYSLSICWAQTGSFKGQGLAFFNEVRVLLSFISSKFNDNGKIFCLYQNYPNPFNPYTVISYQLMVDGHVSLKVYDLLGREVAVVVEEEMRPGTYEVRLTIYDYRVGYFSISFALVHLWRRKK